MSGIGIAGGGVILGGGSSGIAVEEADVAKVAAATTLDFDANFNVTESPAGEANIAVDWDNIQASDLNITSQSDFGCFIAGDIEWTASGVEVSISGSAVGMFLGPSSAQFGNGANLFRADANRLKLSSTGDVWIEDGFNGNHVAVNPSPLTASRTQDFVDGDGQLALMVSAPASAGASGTPGMIAYDGSFFYVCVATDTWVRAAIATW